jgi:DNA-binding NarL/FixJ family response regulator
MHKPTVLIADDHTMIVDAFRKLLEPHYEIIATVSDGRALLEMAPGLKPDVITIDIGMPRLNGLAAGQRLKQLLPKTKIIYVTMNEDGDLAAEAIRAGSSGYLLKSSAGSELLKAIHLALRGDSYVTPLIKQAMEESFIRSPVAKASTRKLTPRQIEVLQLLAEGRLMKEVAAVLGLTPRTVAFHKYRIMEILGIHSNAELIQFAVTHHVLRSSSSID